MIQPRPTLPGTFAMVIPPALAALAVVVLLLGRDVWSHPMLPAALPCLAKIASSATPPGCTPHPSAMALISSATLGTVYPMPFVREPGSFVASSSTSTNESRG